MRKVSIHLRNILIITFQSPFKAVDVSRSKTQFAFSLLDEKPVGKLLHQTFHNIRGTIRAVVLDDQDMELHREVEDVSDDFLDVLLLVVCRDDY